MYIEDGSYKDRWKALWVLSLALIIIALDNTVLNVALPLISKELLAQAKDLQWIVDIYTLFFASLLLTFGTLSDKHGRRRFLNLGMVIFGVGSLGAALSSDVLELIIYRAVTGVGGAMMMPATLSILVDMFRDKQERSKAIAIWGMTFGIGFGFGPVLGGWLVKDFSWQMAFYINIPIVIITILLSYFYLPESKDPAAPKADLLGMLLSIIGLFALVYAIIEAGVAGWNMKEVGLYFVVAGLFLALFVFWELRFHAPMLPLKLFKNPSFFVASFGITLVMFGMMGTMYLFAQYLQTVQGYDPLEAGLFMVPLTIAMSFGAGYAPVWSERYGMKRVTAAGVAVSALGMAVFVFFTHVETSMWVIITGFIVQGFGIGVAMTPATDSIMGAIPENKLGMGSAMNDTTRELGGALSIAVMGAMMNATYLNMTQSIESLKLLPKKMQELVEGSIQGAHIVAGTLHNAHSADIIKAADEAFISGMVEAFLMGTLVTALAAVITYYKLPDTITQSRL